MAQEIFTHLQEALEMIEELQRRYDKMVDDVVLIGAELGVQELSFCGVISRIRELRAIERDLHTPVINVPPLELEAQREMCRRMEAAHVTELSPTEIAYRDAEESIQLEALKGDGVSVD